MDITKCANGECNVKNECLRHLAKDKEFWQSYACFTCHKGNNYKYKLEISNN